jgi:hypothetical protein
MYLTQALHRSLQQAPDEAATMFGSRVHTVAELATKTCWRPRRRPRMRGAAATRSPASSTRVAPLGALPR